MLGNFKEALNSTHFVRIPLVTRASLPQLLKSYSRIEKGTISGVIPKGAFTHPANLHLSLGELSLTTRRKFEAALKILRSAIARHGDRPLTAHVVGIGNSLLSHYSRDLPRALRLFSRLEDPTKSLQRFCQGVNSDLRDEGLMKLRPFENGQVPLQTRVMDTRRLARDPTMDKQHKRSKPRIDATNIHRKYKDFVLMEDVRLQELHISEIGLRKVQYEDVMVAGYRNIATVALPGNAGDGTEPLQAKTEVRIPVRTPRYRVR